jgi:hypothetical protein
MGRNRGGKRRLRPGRRRHRPGRRPPCRYRGAPSSSPPQGFTGGILTPFYRVLFRSLRGAEKREYFNAASSSIVLGCALSAAVIGTCEGGPLMGLLGLALGAIAGSVGAIKGRFLR